PVPVQPQVFRNSLLGAFVGLLVAAGVALLIQSLDDRLSSAERLTRSTGLLALGSVWMRRKDEPATVDQLPPGAGPGVNRNQTSSVAQAYRLLSTNLQFASLGKSPLRTLLVTSCTAGDGKTSTAA